MFRNKETSRDEFIFYSKRLMRLLIERALSFLPSQVPEMSHTVCLLRNPGLSNISYCSLRLTKKHKDVGTLLMLMSLNRSMWSRPLRGKIMKAGPFTGRG